MYCPDAPIPTHVAIPAAPRTVDAAQFFSEWDAGTLQSLTAAIIRHPATGEACVALSARPSGQPEAQIIVPVAVLRRIAGAIATAQLSAAVQRLDERMARLTRAS